MSHPTDPDTQLPPVEFIDDGFGSEAARTDTTAPQRRAASSTILTVAAVVTAFGLLLLLGTIGNGPAEVAAPTTTEAPTTSTTSERAPASIPVTREERLTSIGVLLGPGPGLEWQPIDATIETPHFVWVGDRFVSDDGKTERAAWLTADGPSFETRASPLVDFPGYRLLSAGGDRLLLPEDAPIDHAFIIQRDGPPIRIPLPNDDSTTVGGLTRTQTWVHGSVVGKRFVATMSRYPEIDHAALGERLGIDLSLAVFVEIGTDRLTPHFLERSPESILFDETNLTTSEIEQLRSVNTIGSREQVVSIDLDTGQISPVDLPDLRWTNAPSWIIDGQLTIWWTDSAGQSKQSTTTNGVDWSTTDSAINGWIVFAGSQLIDMASGSRIRRSIDGGETWQSTPSPRQDTQTIAADDVIILGRSWNQFAPPAEVLVESSSAAYDFVVAAPDTQFEVRRPSGETVATGVLWSLANNGGWDDDTDEYVVVDPATGDELLRVAESAVTLALAEANPMTEIDLTRWPADQEHPEWRLASPVELFGAGALTVDFVSGDSQILAVVTTVDGYRLFITDTTPP